MVGMDVVGPSEVVVLVVASIEVADVDPLQAPAASATERTKTRIRIRARYRASEIWRGAMIAHSTETLWPISDRK